MGSRYMLDLQFVLSTSVVGGLAGWLIFGTLGAAALGALLGALAFLATVVYVVFSDYSL